MTKPSNKYVLVTLTEAQNDRFYGVKGWLIVFCITAILGFLSSWGSMVGSFSKEYPGFKGGLFDFLSLDFDGVIGLRVLFVAGIAELLFIFYLMFSKHKKFRIYTTLCLILSFPLGVIILMIFGGSVSFSSVNTFIQYLISSTIWCSYLNMSKRVRITFDNTTKNPERLTILSQLEKITSTEPKKIDNAENSVISSVAFNSDENINRQLLIPQKYIEKNLSEDSVGLNINHDVSVKPIEVDIEQVWATAFAEFESDNRKQGVWAMAFAEANGVEALAKASYLKIRVSQLTAEKSEQIKQANVLKVKLAKEAITKQEHEEWLAQNPTANAACPNCNFPVHDYFLSCPKCKADFGSASSWAPRRWK